MKEIFIQRFELPEYIYITLKVDDSIIPVHSFVASLPIDVEDQRGGIAEDYIPNGRSNHLSYPLHALNLMYRSAGKNIVASLSLHVCNYGSISYVPGALSPIFYRYSTVLDDYVLIDYKKAFLRGVCDYLGLDMPNIDLPTTMHKRVLYAYLASGAIMDDMIFSELALQIQPVVQAMVSLRNDLLLTSSSSVTFEGIKISRERFSLRHILFLPFSLRLAKQLQTLHQNEIPFFYVRKDSILILRRDFEKAVDVLGIQEDEVHIREIPKGSRILNGT